MTSYTFEEFLQKSNLTESEYFELKRRIKNLRIDQICALCELLNIDFKRQDLENIAKSIKEQEDPVLIDTIITEAKSIEDLKFWLDLFEKEKF